VFVFELFGAGGSWGNKKKARSREKRKRCEGGVWRMENRLCKISTEGEGCGLLEGLAVGDIGAKMKSARLTAFSLMGEGEGQTEGRGLRSCWRGGVAGAIVLLQLKMAKRIDVKGGEEMA